MPNGRRKFKKMPTVRHGISDSMELRNLLYAISEEFPLVISANLTDNKYKILEYENFATQKASAQGVFDDLIKVGASTIAPEHKQVFIDTFSREKLLKAYARGEKRVTLETRQIRDTGDYGWVKTTVIFFVDPDNGNIMEISLAKPIEEQKAKELENMRLRTVLEMSMLANYEYVSIVNIKTGEYELYANNGCNSHNVAVKGDFNEAAKLIRSKLVPEVQRSSLISGGGLSAVIAKMEENGGHFNQRYRINDTPERRWREAAFQYCLPGKDELLMTVRDVHDEVMAEQSKRAEEMLRRNRERQQLLTGLGFDIIVDIDLTTYRAELLGEAKSFLKRDIIYKDFPLGELRAGMVHPKDIGVITNAMRLVNRDDTFCVDFRYKRGDGVFFWCRCKAVILKEENGKPYRCVCRLTDIDEQKKSEQKLMYDAQRDLLTGLYNNMTTQILIGDYLLGKGAKRRHALMVIDVDNLKQVNDTFGHNAGDKLIKSLAEALKSSFRSSDIVGRIGGDEFVVFLKNIETPSFAVENAKKLQKRLKPVPFNGSGEGYVPVCSVGLALYPEHGGTYADIFRRADEALYHIKEHGKNGVKLYETLDACK